MGLIPFNAIIDNAHSHSHHIQTIGWQHRVNGRIYLMDKHTHRPLPCSFICISIQAFCVLKLEIISSSAESLMLPLSQLHSLVSTWCFLFLCRNFFWWIFLHKLIEVSISSSKPCAGIFIDFFSYFPGKRNARLQWTAKHQDGGRDADNPGWNEGKTTGHTTCPLSTLIYKDLVLFA